MVAFHCLSVLDEKNFFAVDLSAGGILMVCIRFHE